MELLMVASKYMLTYLVDQCECFIEKGIFKDNAAYILGNGLFVFLLLILNSCPKTNQLQRCGDGGDAHLKFSLCLLPLFVHSA